MFRASGVFRPRGAAFPSLWGRFWAGELPALVSCPSSRVRCCCGAVLLQLLPAAGGLSPSARPQGSAQTGGQGLSGGANGSFSRPAFPSHTGCLFLPAQAARPVPRVAPSVPETPPRVLTPGSCARLPSACCWVPARERVSAESRRSERSHALPEIRAAGSASPRLPSPKHLVFPSTGGCS